jgi:hypothetical protein
MKFIQYSALVSLLASWAFQGALPGSNEHPGTCGKEGTPGYASFTPEDAATSVTRVRITAASPGTGNYVDDPTNGEDGTDSQLADGHDPTLIEKKIFFPSFPTSNSPPKPENVGTEKGLTAHDTALGKGIENGLTALGNAHGKGIAFVGICTVLSAWIISRPPPI